jgi:hypothetical protein
MQHRHGIVVNGHTPQLHSKLPNDSNKQLLAPLTFFMANDDNTMVLHHPMVGQMGEAFTNAAHLVA